MQIKTTLKFLLILGRISNISNANDNLCSGGCAEKGTLLITVSTATMEINMAMILENWNLYILRPNCTTLGYIPTGCLITPHN